MDSPIHRLLAASAVQDGVVTRAQLLAAGIAESQIDSWRRTQRLLPVLPGVYSVGRSVETHDGVWRAAMLAAGDDAVLMGVSAACIWGMVGTPPGIPKRVEVARPRHRRLIRPAPGSKGPVIQVCERTLHPDEIRHVRGIQLTSPARTLIDIAGTGDKRLLRHAFIEACRLHLIDKSDLQYCLARSRNLCGAASLRKVIGLWIPGMNRTNSILEGQFLLKWCEVDQRIPEVNVKLSRWEFDFLWAREGLVVELDGQAYHGNEIAQRRDGAKDVWLRERGLAVLRFGYHDVNDNFERVTGLIRHHLDQPPG